jgi:glutamate-5-semialdehyde dehydrogenase
LRVVIDSKTNYPAACNSCEKLLIHSNEVNSMLVPITQRLVDSNVKLRVCAETYCNCYIVFSNYIVKLEHVFPEAITARKITKSAPLDYKTEFLDLEIAVLIVDSIDSAISHINQNGSHHTDSIVTENQSNAEMFMRRVDSAGVYWNCSTRFADGFRYGFGAEIGVSTNKTHARGPVGLEGLVIYKYRMYGNGHIVAEYNSGVKKYNRKHIEDPKLNL